MIIFIFNLSIDFYQHFTHFVPFHGFAPFSSILEYIRKRKGQNHGKKKKILSVKMENHLWGSSGYQCDTDTKFDSYLCVYKGFHH